MASGQAPRLGPLAAITDATALVAERVLRGQLASVPELAALRRTDEQDGLSAAAEVSVVLVATCLQRPGAMPGVLPDAVARLVCAAVQQGIGGLSILRAARVVQSELTELVLERAAQEGTPFVEAQELCLRIARICGALTDLLVAEHRRAAEELDARPESQRTVLVRRILDGDDDVDLGHPMEGPHVAVIARGRSAQLALRAVLSELPGAVFVARSPDQSLWAWLCIDASDEAVAEIWRAAGAGGVAGVASGGSGVTGFRAAHRKARIALRLAGRRGLPVVAYNEMALEALAFGDRSLAREFVDVELGPLLSAEPRVVAVRETVNEYFLAGSARQASERLHVSERTVVYRLRNAEQLLGRPLTERRAELETALRLHRLFELEDA
jgi:hypothetical protein